MEHREESAPAESLSTVKKRIDWLASLYQFRDYARVEEFLRANPSLTGLLLEAHKKIRDYFGTGTPIALEVFTDYEGESESGEEGPLFALILTDLPWEEASNRLDRLDEEWWIDAMPRDGLLIVSIEFI